MATLLDRKKCVDTDVLNVDERQKFLKRLKKLQVDHYATMKAHYRKKSREISVCAADGGRKSHERE